MADRDVLLAFVHGWSVTNTETYGGLPPRLRNEAKAQGINLRVRHVLLGRYISFHDEVRLPDLSRAFAQACRDEIEPRLADGQRFVCITHSTGGPVIRDWWQRYYRSQGGQRGNERRRCPMSHLIMLAPANYGSALAQLGKGRLGRLKAWLGGVEPGQGVRRGIESSQTRIRAEPEETICIQVQAPDRCVGQGLSDFRDGFRALRFDVVSEKPRFR